MKASSAMRASKVQQRVDLFAAVQKLPYQINNAALDTSCVAKTKLLGELLTRLGLKCEVWKAVVDWRDTGIPNELLSLAPRPTVNHFFLRVYVPERLRWVNVDATWDDRFIGTLPVNTWDGLSNTKLAYPTGAKERLGSVSEFTFRNFDPNDQFTKQLNEWYKSLTERK